MARIVNFEFLDARGKSSHRSHQCKSSADDSKHVELAGRYQAITKLQVARITETNEFNYAGDNPEEGGSISDTATLAGVAVNPTTSEEFPYSFDLPAIKEGLLSGNNIDVTLSDITDFAAFFAEGGNFRVSEGAYIKADSLDDEKSKVN